MNSNSKIVHLEETVQQFHNTVEQLRTQHADSQHRADSLVQVLRAHEQKHQCEALYTQGRIIDAAVSLLEITNTISEIRGNKLIMEWLARFTLQCVTTLERVGDEASNAKKLDEAVAAYSTAILLSPSNPNTVLTKWASIILIHSTMNKALSAATKFQVPRFAIYRTICNVLEEDGRIKEAIDCFRQMRSELSEDTSTNDERVQWELGGWLQQQCSLH
ncbi:hypothetical protein J3R83DRAFT_5154 [Lanmaoa asiatica]|nr:hypothetical protein J3R83DRAFT_5154 [Lanmaoa asiatica]